MVLGARGSGVAEKPRVGLVMGRSASGRPVGAFHNAMSRVMFTSCGIQWLEQVARYFSQAHLYLNGTSWLTSVWPLMIRLSAAFTRRWFACAAAMVDAARACTGLMAPSFKVRIGCGTCDATDWSAGCERGEWLTSRFNDEPLFAGFGGVGLTSSSQVSMCFPVLELSEQ